MYNFQLLQPITAQVDPMILANALALGDFTRTRASIPIILLDAPKRGTLWRPPASSSSLARRLVATERLNSGSWRIGEPVRTLDDVNALPVQHLATVVGLR